MDSKSACLFSSEEDAVSSKVACYANMSKKTVGNEVGQSVPHSRDVKTDGGILKSDVFLNKPPRII